MIAPLLIALAALGLMLGAGLIAWPVRASGPAAAPALYRRRILGAMLVGASLFLGGFTYAARHPIF